MINHETEYKIKFRYTGSDQNSDKIMSKIKNHFDSVFFNSDVEITVKSVYKEPTTRCEE